MMRKVNFPEGWIETTLIDLTDVVRGVTYNKSQSSSTPIENYLPVLRANNIQNDKLILSDFVYVKSSLIKETQKIRANDLIVTMSSGSKSVVGKTARSDTNLEAGFGAFCGLLRPNKYIQPKLISFYTRSAYYRNKISELSAGANINNLKPAHFADLIFPLPPLAEQEIISEKLDTLLAEVETTKARLERIPKILKCFRQSFLAAAVSGKLTEAWRNESAVLLEDWESTNIGFLAEVATGKTPKRTDIKYWENGTVPWLTSAATGCALTFEAEQFVTELAVKECTLKVFPAGTLLLAMYGEGKTRGQVTEIRLPATCNQACAAILADESKVTRDFLKIRLEENYEETRKSAAGGAQPNLNLNKVREISVLLPSLQEQTEIVRRVEQLFAYADNIEQKSQAALARVNNLTQAILAKAFKGELTADWRAANPDLISGENSAEALLEKIKAEREAITSSKKTSIRKKA